MDFKSLLNEYYEQINCSQSELASACNLSASVISRYLSGERQPSVDSQQLESLALGLSQLAKEKGLNEDEYEYVNILLILKQSIKSKEVSFDIFTNSFNELIDCFSINMKALANGTSFDVSYLYRVRSGERHPSDIENFSNLISEYIADNYNSEDCLLKISQLLKCDIELIKDKHEYISQLNKYLLDFKTEAANPDYMRNFLQQLDSFDLDEYIRTIHFDELKVPSVPFQLPTNKKYYGSTQMRKGELDFFKTTVLSKSMEDIFMCSDMPMTEMAEDMDFNRKWMFAIAMSLKKGLHLNIIHDVNRPFEEMMLGLEAWMPIYMTGQISPYYLPEYAANIYHHITYVSGTVALTGECIHDQHENGMYYLTNNKDEVAYYKKRATDLLSKAEPLMEVFTNENKNAFTKFVSNQYKTNKNKRNMLSVPPLYCMSEELLESILSHNNIDETLVLEIKNYVANERKNFETFTKAATIQDSILELSQEEFYAHPLSLFLADIFLGKPVYYTYSEYKKHLELCKEANLNKENYSCNVDTGIVFRNIQIQITEGTNVLISKAKPPLIHLNVRHPKMVDALEHFEAPV